MVLHYVFRVLPEAFLAACFLCFAACPAEKEVIDAIKKQNDEINKQQEKVKNLVDRIAAEIERTSCFEGR